MKEQEKKINNCLDETENKILELNNELNLLALPIIKYLYDKFNNFENNINEVDPIEIIKKIDDVVLKAEKVNEKYINNINKTVNEGIKDIILTGKKEYGGSLNFDVSLNMEVAKFKKSVINLYEKLKDAMYHKFDIDLKNDLLESISLVSKGYETYDKVIKDTIKKLISDGTNKITHVTKNGKVINYSVYTVVRRNVVTSINQLATAINKLHLDDLNTDLVEVTAHVGARPSHQEWQGKVYTTNINNIKYPHLSETRYGAVDGLAGANCRHTFYPFVEGVSERAYTDEELNNMKKAEGKIFLHKEVIKVPMYEAVQTQRKIERVIRKKKEIAQAYLKTFGEDSKEYKRAKEKVKEWINEYSLHCKLNGFYKESERLGNYIKWK